MIFDWIGFLHERGVYHITTGKNVKRGNANVACPFCGPADPSQHMGIYLSTGGWSCHRDRNHRGRKPQALVMALLKCSWEQASAIVGDFVEDVGIDELVKRTKELDAVPAKGKDKPQPIAWAPGLRKVGACPDAVDYLHRRGFRERGELQRLGRLYRLRYGLYGQFAGRLVMPFLVNRMVMGWTARAVRPSGKRYLEYPEGSGKQFLFNEDARCTGGRVLVVVEGPIDTINLDFHGRERLIRATGILGTNYTQSQINKVIAMSSRFDRTVVVLDADAQDKALTLQAELSVIDAEFQFLPEGVDDPGAMNHRQTVDFLGLLDPP